MQIAQESASLIEREVATLAALVNEFSQFVRFPTAKLPPTDANTIVHEALEVFSGRLDGITLKTSLEDSLPPVRADAALLRSVVVNLIDNAAEALEDSTFREIPYPPISVRNPILSKSLSPTPATASPRRTKTNCSFRIFPPRTAAPVSVWPSPPASSPNTAAAFTWRTTSRSAPVF